jgi:hypothetical protein
LRSLAPEASASTSSTTPAYSTPKIETEYGEVNAIEFL